MVVAALRGSIFVSAVNLPFEGLADADAAPLISLAEKVGLFGAQIINGAIYLPSQNVTFNGGSSTGTSCMQLIANTITFSGNANFKHSCASAGVIDPPGNPVLAE